MGDRKNLVTVLGHTAAGKTRFAAILAHHLGGEIISADSRQVYRGMDLGTGKDYGDYLVGGKRVPVHLVDIAEAGEEYNVFRFRQDFEEVYRRIREKGKIPVMCGGTGLYLESVLRNYRMADVPVNRALREELEGKDMETLRGILGQFGPLHNVTDTGSRVRLVRAIEIAMHPDDQEDWMGEGDIPLSSRTTVLGIRYDRESRRQRITLRLEARLSGGLVEEVQGLLNEGIAPEKMEYYGLEYRYVTRYLNGELTYEEMFRKLNTAIHRFAKRQMTYFRGMEKRGVPIHWLEGDMPLDEKIEIALAFIAAT
jgi:tRNA dimethylallyltransferase